MITSQRLSCDKVRGANAKQGVNCYCDGAGEAPRRRPLPPACWGPAGLELPAAGAVRPCLDQGMRPAVCFSGSLRTPASLAALAPARSHAQGRQRWLPELQ